jgi:hypothetical protein
MLSSWFAVASSRIELQSAMSPAPTSTGMTAAVPVSVIAIPPATAEIVFASAREELNAAVNTPVASVLPEADGMKSFPLPLADSTTGDPLTRFPNWSLTVPVTVDAWMPATQENAH